MARDEVPPLSPRVLRVKRFIDAAYKHLVGAITGSAAKARRR